MATARQLYPTSRTDHMTDDQLQTVLRFALYDQADTNHGCVYAGMDRADTVATAKRTRRDVAAVLRQRAVAALTCSC